MFKPVSKATKVPIAYFNCYVSRFGESKQEVLHGYFLQGS